MNPSRETTQGASLRLLQRDREEAPDGVRLGLADVAGGRVHALSDAFDDLPPERHVDKDEYDLPRRYHRECQGGSVQL
jgi:hypothetical protein